MRLSIAHLTRYTYDREVQLQPHLLYLRPRDNPLLKVHDFRLSLTPQARIDWMCDDFDNMAASTSFTAPTPQLEIVAESDVETDDVPPFDFLVRDYAVAFPFQYEPLHRFNLSLYLEPPAQDVQGQLRAWVDQVVAPQPTETVAFLFALNAAINRNLGYQRRDDYGIQTSTETLASGSGTCRDFAALLVDCARTLGLAARFVSGYLFDPTFDASLSGDMHAWVEIFLPGAGWRGLDPTNGIFCHSAYVPVAHAVVAASVNPVQGSFFSAVPATSQMHADVRVREVNA